MLALSLGAYLVAALGAALLVYFVMSRRPSLTRAVLLSLALGVAAGVLVVVRMTSDINLGPLETLIVKPVAWPLLAVASARDIDPVAFMLLFPLSAVLQVAFVGIAVSVVVDLWRSRGSVGSSHA